MRHYGLVAVMFGFAVVPFAIGADDYVLEPPDILRVDVAGLPQPLKGDFVVAPDGTVSLGSYGSVSVSGLTLDQTRVAITNHLSARVKKEDKLEVRADVAEGNSKVYYIIRDSEHIYRFPVKANDTVASAVLQVEGLSEVATKAGVSLATPLSKVREVDWRAITQEGRLATNYKLSAGDRVYIGSAPPK